uniref:MIF4G domain-containing protein n=1 Tax=Anopheles dirus TaxID=7168 RepID=A0A182MXL8_9DIPT
MDQRNEYPPLRAPKSTIASVLSVDAAIFVPKSITPKEQQQHHYQQCQPQMASHVHQRFAMAQGGVEPGGGDGDGGGGGYDYAAQMAHGGGGGAGPMANGVSALQNRLSNMQIGEGDGAKEFNHHQHHQQPMHHHHQQQHRGQQHPGGGHHGGYHQQQQQHQSYAYGIGTYGNNHHHLGNHQVQHHGGGGMPGGEHRKYNNGGGQHQQQHHHRGGRGQHHHYQHQGQHHQHHHHHQQQQQQHQPHQYGGSHHHDSMGGGGGGYNAMGSNWGPMGGQDGFEQHRKSEALDYLTAVIAELFDNPGMFDEVKKKLPNELGDLVHDQFVLSSAIEMIFEQSIQESNFRYMGARLCQLLDSLDQGLDSLVRHLLHLKLDDLERVALPEYMKQEHLKVRGATLFLAELYMQLRNSAQTFGKVISEHIISAINMLLQKESPENIKCVCQCLKLCGFELEQDCPDKVESILKTLEQLKVQSSAQAMIHSVLDLRNISWGRSEELTNSNAAVAAVAAPPPPMPATTVPGMHQHLPAGMGMGPGFHDSPVFYGPDGQVLTEEESSFLETNGFEYPANSGFDDSDDDEFGLDEQDPEVREAFQDFLQSNRSNQLQQQQQQQQQQHLPGV